MNHPDFRFTDPQESHQPYDKATIRRETLRYVARNEGLTSGELQTLAARDGANIERQESLRKRLHELERDDMVTRGDARKDPS